MRADIHHRPWPLQKADALVELDGLAPVPLEGEPLCHYAERQDVVILAARAAVTPRRSRAISLEATMEVA